MNLTRLRRIRLRLEELRSRTANIKSRELVALAESLGRRPSKRGKEPTYVSDHFPSLRPISIPSHSGTMKRFTASNILNMLEEDIFLWEDILEK